jgi:hypothetical protein
MLTDEELEAEMGRSEAEEDHETEQIPVKNDIHKPEVIVKFAIKLLDNLLEVLPCLCLLKIQGYIQLVTLVIHILNITYYIRLIIFFHI